MQRGYSSRATTLRLTNTAILIVVAVLTLTGAYGIIWTLNGWLFDLHRIAGWALIALVPFKAGISWRSLRRGLKPDFRRGFMIIVSLGLAAAALSVLAGGVLWAWRVGPLVLWLGQTMISWHWMLALGLLIPLGLHVWVRWPRPKLVEFYSRRGALQMVALSAAGLAGWWIAETLAKAQATAESPREFTGSRGFGHFAGNIFPITGEWAAEVDIARWRLGLSGLISPRRAVNYADVLALPTSQINTIIDCTTGWYSQQRWQGIPLMALLDGYRVLDKARGIQIRSTTGYTQAFLMDEARYIFLATHVEGEVLSHWHGFPLRAVVPSRRGWFWVKWIAEITVLDTLPLRLPDFR